MFYSFDVLNPRSGKLSVLWLVATGRLKYTKKQDKNFREVMAVNISRSCKQIMRYLDVKPSTSGDKKPPHFSLYLSSMLMYGTVKVYQHQVLFLLDEASESTLRLVRCGLILELPEQVTSVSRHQHLLEFTPGDPFFGAPDDLYADGSSNVDSVRLAAEAIDWNEQVLPTPRKSSAADSMSKRRKQKDADASPERLRVSSALPSSALLLLDDWAEVPSERVPFSPHTVSHIDQITLKEDVQITEMERQRMADRTGIVLPTETEFGPPDAMLDLVLPQFLEEVPPYPEQRDARADVTEERSRQQEQQQPGLPEQPTEDQKQQGQKQSMEEHGPEKQQQLAETPVVKSAKVVARRIDFKDPLLSAEAQQQTTLPAVEEDLQQLQEKTPAPASEEGTARARTPKKSVFPQPLVGEDVTPAPSVAVASATERPPPQHQLSPNSNNFREVSEECSKKKRRHDEYRTLKMRLGQLPTADVDLGLRRGRAARGRGRGHERGRRPYRRLLIDRDIYIERGAFREQMNNSDNTQRVLNTQDDRYNISWSLGMIPAAQLLAGVDHHYHHHHDDRGHRDGLPFPRHHLVHHLHHSTSRTLVRLITSKYRSLPQLEAFDVDTPPARRTLQGVFDAAVERAGETEESSLLPELSSLFASRSTSDSKGSRSSLLTPDISGAAIGGLRTSRLDVQSLRPIPEEPIVGVDAIPAADQLQLQQEEQQQAQLEPQAIVLAELELGGPQPIAVPEGYYIEASDSSPRVVKRRTAFSPLEGMSDVTAVVEVHPPPAPDRMLPLSPAAAGDRDSGADACFKTPLPPPAKKPRTAFPKSSGNLSDESPQRERLSISSDGALEPSPGIGVVEPIQESPIYEFDLPKATDTSSIMPASITECPNFIPDIVTPIRKQRDPDTAGIATTERDSLLVAHTPATPVSRTEEIVSQVRLSPKPPKTRIDEDTPRPVDTTEMFARVFYEWEKRGVNPRSYEEVARKDKKRTARMEVEAGQVGERDSDGEPASQEVAGVTFTQLFPDNCTRLLAARLFSSLLEMHKNREVILSQEENYGPIYVWPLKN